MYNCHSHTFNARYVPKKFLAIEMDERAAVIVGRLMKTPVLNKATVAIISRLGPNYRKYAGFLSVGIKKTQDMVFEEMQKAYPKGTRIVALPLNFQFMGAGELDVNYEQQLDDLLQVRAKNPNECLPFVFIDPRMGTAQQNRAFVEKYLNRGFVGIKLYPSLGYYPYDPRLEEVYRFAEEKEVPIMVHCSKGGIFYNGEELEYEHLHPQTFNSKFPPRISGDNKTPRDKFKDNFLQPYNYEAVLDKFPRLKICFAHYGGDSELELQIKNKPNWYAELKDLMKRYENVYVDISYTLHEAKYREKFLNDLSDPVLRNRIMYGTDFFMTLREDNVTERDLYTDTLKHFGNDNFQQIAVTNVEKYLKSPYY
jgi:uncharacterized protein